MKLRWRWSLWMLALGLLLVAIDMAALQWWVRREVARQDANWRSRMQAEAQRLLSERGDFVLAAVDRLVADPEFVEWSGHSQALQSWIARVGEFARGAELEQILILDREGRVAASSLHPESYGLEHPSAAFLSRALRGSPLLYEEWDGAESPIYLGALRDLGSIRVVAALRWDSAEWDAAGELRQWPTPRWRIAQGIETPANFQLQRAWQLVLGDGRAPEAVALRGLARTMLFLQLGLLAVASILGLWFGRRAASPVVRLLRSIDENRSGGGEGVGELESLSRRFSTMASELRAAQEQRLAAERRGAWRESAQRIAHEIKNVLSPLALALDNLETTAGRQDDRARQISARSLQTAREQLDSLDRLVGEFRAFARIPPPSLRDLDVRALCRAAADALRESFPQQPLQVVDGPSLHGLRGDEEQLRRALVNLLRNAAEAEPGAAIELRFGDGPGDDHWWCAVRDQGPGLPEEILAHLGEAVQSSKPQGRGLGLSIVVQTLRAHGGRLSARNLEPRGCELRWELPKRPRALELSDGET